MLPEMESKYTPTRCQKMPVDTKEDTHNVNTSVSYDNASDVTVKKEVDNKYTLVYNVVTDVASKMSMVMEDEDVKLERLAQTDCDRKMELTAKIPDTGRPYPVLLVQVKQELDDVEGGCPEHDTTVHSDIKLPDYGMWSGDDTKFAIPRSKYLTHISDMSVKQEVHSMHQGLSVINTDTRAMKIDMEVKDVKIEPIIHMECASNLYPDMKDQVTHPLPVLLVNVNKEVDKEESECVEHKAAILSSRRTHTCKTCMKTYTDKRDLTGHMVVHSVFKSFTCLTCTKSFTQKCHLIRHMDNVHGGEKLHTCGTCMKSFTSNAHLTTHVATVHRGERSYTCETCMKSFTQKGHLTSHIATVHNEERRHTCGTCLKSFALKFGLTRHMTVHSGIKPYKCVTCTKSFTQKGHLITHVATVHGGDKLHTCDTCLKSFTTKSYLTKHMAKCTR
jgi:hypothetical protein